MGNDVIVVTAGRRGGANWAPFAALFPASAGLKFSNNRFRSGRTPAPATHRLHRLPMDNAVATRPNAALPLVEPAGFGARMAALPLKSKLTLGLGIAALGAVVLAMSLWSSPGD